LLYTFLLWFTPIPISAPVANSELWSVSKMEGAGSQLGGIVCLVDVRYPCPLAPVLDEAFWEGDVEINEDNATTVSHKFYLNSFSLHIDYELLQ
jgi:hypothetical protein